MIHPWTDPLVRELPSHMKLIYFQLLRFMPRTGMKIIFLRQTAFFFCTSEIALEQAIYSMALSGLLSVIKMDANKYLLWLLRLPNHHLKKAVEAARDRYAPMLDGNGQVVLNHSYSLWSKFRYDVVEQKFYPIPAHYDVMTPDMAPQDWIIDLLASMGMDWKPEDETQGRSLTLLQGYGEKEVTKAFDQAVQDGKKDLAYVQLLLEASSTTDRGASRPVDRAVLT